VAKLVDLSEAIPVPAIRSSEDECGMCKRMKQQQGGASLPAVFRLQIAVLFNNKIAQNTSKCYGRMYYPVIIKFIYRI
jgi:hypothetical protein